MDAVYGIKDHVDIRVTIGQSPKGFGRGLFLSILSEVENVTLPGGSLICDYGKGEFKIGRNSMESLHLQSNKAVAYSIHDLGIGIVFEEKFMPLLAALDIMEQRNNNAGSSNKFQIIDAVLGHTIIFNNEFQPVRQVKELSMQEIIEMEIKPKYLERCFTPFEVSDRVTQGQLG